MTAVPSTVRILSDADVRALLPMRDCVEVMAEALRALSRGDATVPVRSLMWLPDRHGLLGMMPAHFGPPRAVGIKVVTVMPGNQGTPLESHQGAVLLFEAEQGRLLGVLDAASITTIRTAAASAAATRALARADASDLAILGSGVQASAHAEAMMVVRTPRRIRVWSRNGENARRFAARESARLGIPVQATASARDAVEGADLICATTGAGEPVLSGDWIAPGAHVNAVGACFPAARELDTAAVARARVFVDQREAALVEAGDLLIPIREGAITESHIRGEIGDVLLGRMPGRADPADITLFKSLGLGIEDLAAAHHVYRAAVSSGRGEAVDWGGRREAG